MSIENKYKFHWFNGAAEGGLIPKVFKQKCINLYSNHYGAWGVTSPIELIKKLESLRNAVDKE